MSKVLKDPIYGYIEIEESIMHDIIDSSCFQRLRSIRQTSYSPLYPSAMHNRFIHSIGVYYLGVKAINTLKQDIVMFSNEKFYNEIKRIFLLACLLHDVGHAPFSHTGEKFYIQNQFNSINDQLIDVVNTNDFKSDIKSRSDANAAAPHEIMSVVVALKTFPDYFQEDKEKEFFARCITGYKYKNYNTNESIKNCLIELLNSSMIDLDKLDYIIRDAQVIGFKSVAIDYIRLLKALRIIDYHGKKTLAYHKGALSIIENVIYAHDAERKWIQNHPVVLYEHFLLQHSIRKIESHYSNNNDHSKLFSYQSLSDCGEILNKDNVKVSLLADEDILFMMKNVYRDKLINEYFARNTRRHPVWKSEAEFRVLFDRIIGDQSQSLDTLVKSFKDLEKYLIDTMDYPIINDEFISHCQSQLRLIDNAEKDLNEDILKIMEDVKSGLLTLIKWSECLKKFANQNDIPFDFAVISANKFSSGFSKEDLDNILIDFSPINSPSYIKKIAPVLNADSRNRANYFYLYYKRESDTINAKELARALNVELLNCI